jgi:hypothetical protein
MLTMKKMWFASRNVLAAATLACAFVFTSCDEDQEDVGSNMYSISGNANGSQMVPTVTGNGSATITGTYDANTNTLIYTTTWTGLSGNATTGGFFAGNAGQSGTAVGSAWTFGANAGASGTQSGQVTLTDAQETQLLNGGLYYTIGTATRQSGEVRGQITATRM